MGFHDLAVLHEDDVADSEEVRELHTRFKRSKHCRVIHVDGAWGSLTPQLNVHMAVYSEHRAFPEGTIIRPSPDGGIQDTPKDDPQLLVREIEADLILSQGSATALRDWLTDRLSDLQNYQREVKEQQQAALQAGQQ
jgi:hypothetical protein